MLERSSDVNKKGMDQGKTGRHRIPRVLRAHKCSGCRRSTRAAGDSPSVKKSGRMISQPPPYPTSGDVLSMGNYIYFSNDSRGFQKHRIDTTARAHSIWVYCTDFLPSARTVGQKRVCHSLELGLPHLVLCMLPASQLDWLSYFPNPPHGVPEGNIVLLIARPPITNELPHSIRRRPV
jgi:hypothetical protein